MNWGNWEFNSDNWILLYKPEQYEIDLEEINSSAEILDWVFQIRDKQWCDAQILDDMLTAFYEILDPQKNYCSFGKNSEASGAQLARAFFDSRRKSE